MRSVWNKLPAKGKAGLLLGLAALAGVLILAARDDLAARSSSETSEDPEVWDKVATMPGGATAYLIGGRRQSSQSG